MNVIFLDFDGVLNTIHYSEDKDIERRIKILAEVCREYDCKVVIEAAQKTAIDEETMEIATDARFVRYVLSLLDKYGIECIGRTPGVRRILKNGSYLDMWKEDEIRLYLLRHPEIDHYCIIDDNDAINMFRWKTGDLDKVNDHLVETIYYSPDNPDEEGLLPQHKEQIGKVLKKENDIRKSLQRRRGKINNG